MTIVIDYAARGEELARLLLLKKKRNGRYDTAWGDKTPLGLYATIKRVMDKKWETT